MVEDAHEDLQEDPPGDSNEAVQLLDYAYYYMSRGELEQASELALEARDLFDELQLAGGSAESRWLLGLIKYDMGEFKAALPFLASAQQQFASLGLLRKRCATLYLLAHCHLGLERPSKAIYALKLARTINSQKDLQAREDEHSNYIPDWETLNDLIARLLDQLEDLKIEE